MSAGRRSREARGRRARSAERPAPPTRLSVEAVTGLPEVREGDDVAALIAERAELADGDVVCVAHKVVSKAEGALAELDPGLEVDVARRRLARAQAARIVADAPWVTITETSHGLVCANGGIDASNAPPGMLVLLPTDPDASARALRARLRELTGVDLAVLVTDTFGRPWRLGLTDVAIGCAGLAPLRDERGATDRAGLPLAMTQTAIADALAAAADCVRDKAAGLPAVVVRGVAGVGGPDGPGAAALRRSASEDLFARGRGMLAGQLGAVQPHPLGEPVAPDDLDRATRVATARGVTITHLQPSTAPTRLRLTAREPLVAAAAAGMLVAAIVDLGHQARLAGDLGAHRDRQRGAVVEAAAGR